jgi:hypothetical protein
LYLLHLQTPDGANSLAIGELGEINGPMVIIGGNCSLQGYDIEGNENFWTVIIIFPKQIMFVVYCFYSVFYYCIMFPKQSLGTYCIYSVFLLYSPNEVLEHIVF